MLARPLRPGPENRCSDHKPVSQAGGLSRANGLIRDADSSVRPAEQAKARSKAWLGDPKVLNDNYGQTKRGEHVQRH